MRAQEKAGLVASVIATVVVVVLGTALSIALGSFARGFVALGAISLIAASAILWRPFASRLLEEGIWSARLDGAIDLAYRRRQAPDRRKSPRGSILAILLAVLFGLAIAVFLGLIHGSEEGATESPIAADTSVPIAKPKPKPNPHAQEHGRSHHIGDPRGSGAGHSREGRSSEAVEPDPESAGGVSAFPPVETSPRPKGGEKVSSAESSSAADAGGGSPVVPILIAVAVLAVISIGVVLYRQRHSGENAAAASARHRMRP
jgi:hypothetical protein